MITRPRVVVVMDPPGGSRDPYWDIALFAEGLAGPVHQRLTDADWIEFMPILVRGFVSSHHFEICGIDTMGILAVQYEMDRFCAATRSANAGHTIQVRSGSPRSRSRFEYCRSRYPHADEAHSLVCGLATMLLEQPDDRLLYAAAPQPDPLASDMAQLGINQPEE